MNIRHTCLLIAVFSAASMTCTAQEAMNCPDIVQMVQPFTSGGVTTNTTVVGVQNGAFITVDVLGSSSDLQQTSSVAGITDSIDAIASISNSNLDYLVNTPTTDPTIANATTLANTGTDTNPVHVFVPGAPSDVAALGGNCTAYTSACTAISITSSGVVAGILTIVNTQAGNTGFVAAYNTDLMEPLAEHEDSHGELGFADCSTGGSCVNTISDPTVTSDSPTAPTGCDNNQIYNNTNGYEGTQC